MTDFECLDNLSNHDLREKCLEYGLPNVPITDSSRKVMLKKLRATILGTTVGTSAKKTPTTNRRSETVHNLTNKTGRPRINNNNNNNNNATRRTIATVPSSATEGRSNLIKTTTTLSSSDLGSQSEEEDYNSINSPNYALGRQTAATPPDPDSRLRRSVSLSKTGVLTTSYTQEIKPVRTYVETEEADSETELPQSVRYERPSYNVLSGQRSTTDTHTMPTYEAPYERKYLQTNYNLASPLLSQTQLNTTSYSSYDDATTAPGGGYLPYQSSPIQRSPIAGSGSVQSPLGLSNLGRSTNTIGSSNVGCNFAMPPPAAPPLRRTLGSGLQRSTSNSINSSTSALYPNLNEFYPKDVVDAATESSGHDQDTDSELEEDCTAPPVHTPFLSKFTRTLETTKRTPPTLRSPLGRRNLSNEHEIDVKASFKQFLCDVERKYHLKQSFALLLVIVLSIFVYVIISP